MSDSSAISIGTSTAMRHAIAELRYVAPTDLPVLFIGEPGVGKSTLARELHKHSKRDGDFVDCTVTTLQDDLAISQLFGHEQGAFTGAHKSAHGTMRNANNGTLFLDEFHRASPRLIGHFLPILARVPYAPLGGSRFINPNVRVVLATNQDPNQLVLNGTWPADLVGRLGYARIAIPPLRQRVDEILPFATYSIARFREVRGTKAPWHFSAELEEVLMNARYVQNFWSLSRVCEYLAISKRSELGVRDLPKAFVDTERAGGRRRRRPLTREMALAAYLENDRKLPLAAEALEVSKRHLQRVLPKSVRALYDVTDQPPSDDDIQPMSSSA